MRIRRLEMVGIGPFTQRQVIDFTAFDESGLFLLEGPTGSGKSTIIDALTFALYGDVARQKDASKDRLRSNHITDSDPSEADLVFEVGTGIYRVTRTPAYTPAGKKSQRNSKSTLMRVVEDPDAPDGWRTVEPIASGPRDVGSEIPAIVGLDKDQFLQTIVLPQGKFSQFLNATSDAREQILRDPRHHETRLTALAVMLVRRGERTLLPDPSTELRPGDRLLFMGQEMARQLQLNFLEDPLAVDYVRTGIQQPRGWLFRRLDAWWRMRQEARQARQD